MKLRDFGKWSLIYSFGSVLEKEVHGHISASPKELGVPEFGRVEWRDDSNIIKSFIAIYCENAELRFIAADGCVYVHHDNFLKKYDVFIPLPKRHSSREVVLCFP
jgi:hypothetical protein